MSSDQRPEIQAIYGLRIDPGFTPSLKWVMPFQARLGRSFLFIIFGFFCASCSIKPIQPIPPILRQVQGARPDALVDEILSRMTLDEKISMLGGKGLMASLGVPRLGIPDLKMTDGPLGVALTTATMFPASIALSSSWDPEQVAVVAAAIGQEVGLSGNMMLLAPCVNLQRNPWGGRNFESYSEDPFLAAKMTASYVQGVQSQNIIATVKHFALNNQETSRLTMDVHASERSMHELYFPAFEAAVQAGVWSVMAAYNKVNGVFAAENTFLLKEQLKTNWGFQGFVVSDWGATYDSQTVMAAEAGLDDEMPWAYVFSESHIKQALNSSKLSVLTIDDKVRRILRAMVHMDFIGKPTPAEKPVPDDVLQIHRNIALKAAQDGLVLLKNSGELLPLDPAIHSIAVIGPNAQETPFSGAGSSYGHPRFLTHALEAVTARAKNIRVNFNSGEDRAEARRLALKSDVVLVFVGFDYHTEGENKDRQSLSLPGAQNQLIQEMAQVNPRTVVIINSGGSVLMPWLNEVGSVLQAWYLGQEGGRAIASVLFGDVNPSGKLPASFLQKESDAWVQSPAGLRAKHVVVNYDEGIFVGYRYLDQNHIQPLFPFGFGLSYTQFKFGNLSLHSDNQNFIHIRFSVSNVGRKAGAEVAQVYIGRLQHKNFALRELKAFKKVFLQPGESQQIELVTDAHAFSHYDENRHTWSEDKGEFKIQVGNSSRDFFLSEVVQR